MEEQKPEDRPIQCFPPSVQEDQEILLKKPNRGSNEPQWDMGLSSGFECLNLACSGRIDVAFAPDFFYVWSGQSGSGKSFVTMAALAEASINPKYKDYKLILDAPERGVLMNIQKFYGKKLAQRLEPPAGTRENPEYSWTLEHMYHNVAKAVDTGPCVYLLDSMEPLPTEDELRDWTKKDKKREKLEYGEVLADEAGSYGMQRAKINSTQLRLMYNKLQGSGCIWIVIFQARQNIDRFTSQAMPFTKGGGTAPTFYAGLELLSTVDSHIRTNYKEKPIEQGVRCKVRVKKGRITGKDRTVTIPIYHSAGIDSVGGMIDWLVEWKHWERTSENKDPAVGRIKADEFSKNVNREGLVQHITSTNQEEKLRQIVQKVWNGIEEEVAIERKPRYG